MGLAATIADGGEAIRDLAVLHAQPDVFGPARVLSAIKPAVLDRLRAVRARAREVARQQTHDTGPGIPATHAARRTPHAVNCRA